MLVETITYTDYNDEERTEKFYFNLTEAELAEMELSITGGFSEMIQRIIDAKDTPSIIKVFKELLLKAYGEKSPDGKRFIKSKEISEAFSQTEAYSQLFMKLATNDEYAANFVNGLVPKSIAAETAKEVKKIAKKQDSSNE